MRAAQAPTSKICSGTSAAGSATMPSGKTGIFSRVPPWRGCLAAAAATHRRACRRCRWCRWWVGAAKLAAASVDRLGHQAAATVAEGRAQERCCGGAGGAWTGVHPNAAAIRCYNLGMFLTMCQ